MLQKIVQVELSQRIKSANLLSILVVDDEVGPRNAVVNPLRRIGHQVETSSNVLAAIREVLVDLQRFDLVVMDMRMPTGDGVTETIDHAGVIALSAIRASGFNGQIICVTAYADQEDLVAEIRKISPDAIILSKPIRETDLKNAVDTAINQKNTLEASRGNEATAERKFNVVWMQLARDRTGTSFNEKPQIHPGSLPGGTNTEQFGYPWNLKRITSEK